MKRTSTPTPVLSAARCDRYFSANSRCCFRPFTDIDRGRAMRMFRNSRPDSVFASSICPNLRLCHRVYKPWLKEACVFSPIFLIE